MIAGYPMVEEAEATGRVGAVYAAALEQAPFVPSLLKSLALCPAYLVLAWEQAAPVLAGSALSDAADALAASVEDAATPPPQEEDRALLAEFVEPLARMLLLATGLQAALEGSLDGTPASGAAPPAAGPLEPGPPSTADLPDAAALFGRIRADLQTPIVNTVWRQAAGRGRLETIWSHLGPQAAGTRARAQRLQGAAARAARDLPWQTLAAPEALRTAGTGDAAPGMAAVLDAYVVTLPRVLVLVGCCRSAAA